MLASSELVSFSRIGKALAKRVHRYDNVKGVGDEFECRGYEFCREQAILEAEQLERELGIESPGQGGDGGDDDEEDEDAGEKKSRRRKSKSKK